MTLNNLVKQNKDTILATMDVDILNSLPLKDAMKTLELYEYNNRVNGLYFRYSDDVQSFIDNNNKKYNELLETETPEFKELSSLYFESFKNQLYVYADRLLEHVSGVYKLEKHFTDNKINFKKIPKIIYKLNKEEYSNLECLNIQNIEQLNKEFGKATMLHAIILFKDHLNYDYKIKNKTDKDRYTISSDIKSACFDDETQTHPQLESFDGKNYFLTQKFDDQCKTVASPENILKLVLLREDVRNLEQLSNKKKVKP